ncbi:acyltransferase [Chryseobacterium carnipullorum]|uniref:Acyltransferase n=1 Tax=Chryseobacterium carnipullorum TaxID=1124835 RepID=A0A376EKF1_CHRCU|nr:acyltransferase family protein [Chryseobacterium carnipullorum]AZA47437.1 acyltransferase [Chryseobacterium carnipullorum]AZA66775.1 acyltransferase [Chryseobacterium carnipullorum]STD09960.1 O-acetyltransferase OatA [Chryseobacterium carnipullorum]
MLFRNDIQGIRGLAFLLVFIFHLNHNWLPGGFIGVDIFFVISGFLMTSIIIEQKNNNTFSFYDFYIRRLKRIFPAYLFFIIIVAAVGFFIYLDRDFWMFQKSVGTSALFISNILFSRGDSYFGSRLEDNPFLHTWSLSIEMQFYLLLPLILIFTKRRYLTALILLIIFFLTIYVDISMYISNETSAKYFSLLARIPEFLVGAFFSLRFKNKISFSRINNNIISSLSLAVLILSAFLIDKNTFFPGTLALIPTVATASLLVVGDNFISDFFTGKITTYIGETSYSLYLWHWPIIAFIRYYNDDYFLSVSEIFFICILTFLLARFSYCFIENYFRKRNNSEFYRYAGYGAVLLILLSLLLPKAAEINKIPEVYTSPSFGVKSHDQKRTEVFGDKNSKHNKILLIGDSHALAIKPFLDYIGKRNGFSFTTVTTSGLPPLKGIKRSEIPSYGMKFYDFSQQFVKFTEQNISRNKIILINCSSFIGPMSIYQSVKKMADTLKPDQKLIVFGTFPSVDRDPVKINRDFIKKTSKKFKVIIREDNKEALKKLAATNKNVYFYDLSKSKVFKNAPFYKDTLMYYNRTHINDYGSVSLSRDLEKDFMSFFKPIINGEHK